MRAKRTRIRAERVARTVARPGELVKRRWRVTALNGQSLKAWARETLSELSPLLPGRELAMLPSGQSEPDLIRGWLKRKGCRP